MSVESVKAFYEKLEKDENLTSQYQELLRKHATGTPDETQIVNDVIQFAANNGYEFSADDVKQVAESLAGDKISDSRLDEASAAISGYTTGAFVLAVTSSSSFICVVGGVAADY